MPDPINDKPFSPISFSLAANEKKQYETASCATLYFAEGPNIAPGAVSLQFDDFDAFRVAVGLFIRVRRFDKLRIINNTGVALDGVIHVSTDPDLLFLMNPQGI